MHTDLTEAEINRSLRKVDPREFPRAPSTTPARRRDFPVYRIDDTEPFFTIRQDRFATVTWWEKQIVIADYFQCAAEDVGSHEADDGTEVVTVCGKIVGSFDRPISAADVEAIVAALTDASR